MRTRSQARKEALAKAETIVSTTMGDRPPVANDTKALKAFSEPKINDISSSIVRPAIEANTFEIKPSTIQMMTNLDRSWISNQVQSDKISLTPEYRNGVETFLKFASENGMGEDGTMKCPCKRCRNLNWLSIDDVRFHLLAKGMLEGYTVWTSHGEERGRKRSRTSHNRYCVWEPTRVEQPVDLNAMLHDFAVENSEFYNNLDTGTRNVEEVPNDSARKLYEVIVENGAPIYPGNTKYTRLSFTTKLLEFKNISHCSNKAFDSLLTLFADVLPKKHTLPQTYYEMKKIMKGLRVEYQKIDLCENDCMLFYGDDKDKVVCDICGKDHYRDVLRKDGKKILRHFPLIPRLQRLYMSKHTSDHMRWYKNRDVKDGEISHPADGEEWKNFDRRYPSFAQEIRNIRLGLATDVSTHLALPGKKHIVCGP
ncbi:uncharacterized protein LOC135149574 [Daucus carota subsp. sativus]|uniref:uncharacterized protein LOC135149574 n=1 Tax=Daucus carota subsp. sativus TaxID=79200 RepID=UPI0030838399